MKSTKAPPADDSPTNDGEQSLQDTSANNRSTLVQRPTALSSLSSTQDNTHRFNIDDIHMSPSPLNTRPCMFRTGTLFDTDTFERIRATVYNASDKTVMETEEDDKEEVEVEADNQESDGDEHNLVDILNEARSAEIERLSQSIIRDRPRSHTDEFADVLIQLLGDLSQNSIATMMDSEEASTAMAARRPYPPVHQAGPVDDHDRPYADYGHLDRQTIARECGFDLQAPTTDQQSIQFSTKSFAITACTTVSKEIVFAEIKQKISIRNMQYVCIGEEIDELTRQQYVHIQIILKEKVNLKTRFLDRVTQTHCNYSVTQNDLAWNEYIKKGGNYLELNEFKSTKTRAHKQWPSSSSVSTTESSVPSIVRGEADERRQHENEIARQAFKLAETNMDDAMDLILHSMPDKFVEHFQWYLSTFNYVHLRAQREADRRGDIHKEYVWPLSFPGCTPQLRETIDRWIRHHFFRAKHAKCLILIGPTGTGKTAFALSLPGRVNYFQERWSLDQWSDYARYSVYDDVPWNEFSKLNYPNKKELLTQSGKMNVTDKYRRTAVINVRQPAIVLLGPDDAGSLLAEPVTAQDHQAATYWKKRATIYIMGEDEYFYKRARRARTGNDNMSSDSSMSSNEQRLCEPDEFDLMIQLCQQKHSK